MGCIYECTYECVNPETGGEKTESIKLSDKPCDKQTASFIPAGCSRLVRSRQIPNDGAGGAVAGAIIGGIILGAIGTFGGPPGIAAGAAFGAAVGAVIGNKLSSCP